MLIRTLWYLIHLHPPLNRQNVSSDNRNVLTEGQEALKRVFLEITYAFSNLFLACNGRGSHGIMEENGMSRKLSNGLYSLMQNHWFFHLFLHLFLWLYWKPCKKFPAFGRLNIAFSFFTTLPHALCFIKNLSRRNTTGHSSHQTKRVQKYR